MIRNITKKTTLVSKTKLVSSLKGKALGLMLQRKILQQGLVFIFNIENKRSIHTFFMRFPIDIIFLNSKKQVTKIARDIKPWRLTITGKARYIIELPAGSSKNTEIGDVISFK